MSEDAESFAGRLIGEDTHDASDSTEESPASSLSTSNLFFMFFILFLFKASSMMSLTVRVVGLGLKVFL